MTSCRPVGLDRKMLVLHNDTLRKTVTQCDQNASDGARLTVMTGLLQTHRWGFQAIRKLRALGPGFGVITVGGQRLVSSVPHSLSTDTNAVLEFAQVPLRVPNRAAAGQEYIPAAGAEATASLSQIACQ